jgi:hypothetical protein
MIVRDLIAKYEELYLRLELKQDILVNRRIKELAELDEKIVSLYSEIETMVAGADLKPTDDEKAEINALADKIYKIETNNQELIKHSLATVNKLIDGVMNIVQQPSTGYGQSGKMNANSNLDLSSVIEEA